MAFWPGWRRRAAAGFSSAAGRRDVNDLPCRHRPSAPGGSLDRRFTRRRRLRKRAEYLRIQRSHRGRKSPHFVVIFASGPGPEGRLGVTASRKVGSAVQRNRVKRRVREFFRLYRHRLQPAHDLLIIARAGAENLSSKDVESELAPILGIHTE